MLLLPTSHNRSAGQHCVRRFQRPNYERPSLNEIQEKNNFEKRFIWGRNRRFRIVRFRGRLAFGVLSIVRGSDHWWGHRRLRWANDQAGREDAAPHLATQQFGHYNQSEALPQRINVDAFRSYTLYSLSIIRPATAVMCTPGPNKAPLTARKSIKPLPGFSKFERSSQVCPLKSTIYYELPAAMAPPTSISKLELFPSCASRANFTLLPMLPGLSPKTRLIWHLQ